MENRVHNVARTYGDFKDAMLAETIRNQRYLRGVCVVQISRFDSENTQSWDYGIMYELHVDLRQNDLFYVEHARNAYVLLPETSAAWARVVGRRLCLGLKATGVLDAGCNREARFRVADTDGVRRTYLEMLQALENAAWESAPNGS